VKEILQEELGLQEKVGDEWRPGYQARVKKREWIEESDLREKGKRKIIEKVGSHKYST
jgi:hypothetical protein